MDNRNIYNTNPINSYYPYGYPAAAAPIVRPEPTSYMMPQVAPAAPIIKGRPVASLEEARVAQIDLDGSVFFFPDLGNGKIYTKKINADGTASLNVFTLDAVPAEPVPAEYATKNELAELKATLEEMVAKLKPATTPAAAPKISF